MFVKKGQWIRLILPGRNEKHRALIAQRIRDSGKGIRFVLRVFNYIGRCMVSGERRAKMWHAMAQICKACGNDKDVSTAATYADLIMQTRPVA